VSALLIATPWIDFSALWRIIVVGLIAGAGLPALFAIGLRAFNSRPAANGPVSPGDDHVYGGSPLGATVGVVCVAIVLAGIGYGVYFIVHGS
jgi:hypothetical protein